MGPGPMDPGPMGSATWALPRGPMGPLYEGPLFFLEYGLGGGGGDYCLQGGCCLQVGVKWEIHQLILLIYHGEHF